MRKRLWFTICLLDVQTCFDPDSQPLIPFEKTQISMPLNIDDNDIDASTSEFNVLEETVLTDMTFALITYHLQACARRLYSISRSDHSAREQIMHQFIQKTRSLTQNCNLSDSNYSWFVHHAAQNLNLSMTIHNFRQPNHQNPSSVLETCLISLENLRRIHGDGRGEGFRWYVTPQWPHIMLAIKGSLVVNDAVLLKRAMPLIEEAVGHYEESHTDPTTRPKTLILKRLMKRTKRRIDSLVNSESLDNIIAQGQNGSVDFNDMPMDWNGIFGDLDSFNDFQFAECIDWKLPDLL